MPKYLLVYHGGSMPESEEEGQKIMQAWMAWFGEIGASVVDGGNPVGMSKTVMSDKSVADNGGANPVSGYSVLSADSLDGALMLAKGCPHLIDGGTIEVAEIIEMG
nr:hypothetical protein [Mesorhizobium sp.]